MPMLTKLTESQEECLREQDFSADQPGRVLRDFSMLLDFLQEHGGVAAAGKYNLLPLKVIDELDRRLSRPLNLQMQRPLLRSHPYLQGLNLLLRASRLTRVEGAGAKARLLIDPGMMVQWEMLNPTERYFNLLQAWLLLGRPEMVGDSEGYRERLLDSSLTAWHRLPQEGTRYDVTMPSEVYLFSIGRRFYQLALMDLFGIVAVEFPRQKVMPWCPAGIKHLPFGDALFTLISCRLGPVWLRYPGASSHDDVADEDGEQQPGFGTWQPALQPYFPEWRENLEPAEPEMREGTFIFRLSLGEGHRLIAMPASDTLEDLIHWILRSINFDHDHLYSFSYRDPSGLTVHVDSPDCDGELYTDEVEIGSLPLEPGQTMDLLYDYGDNWEFTIKLERIEPPSKKIKAPRIIERRGRAPEQYPRWEEW